MPGYANYGNYGNYCGYGNGQGGNNNAGTNNNWNVGFNNGNTGYNNGWNQGMQSNVPQQDYPMIYVHGRAGADAFQMPNGVNRVILWDDEVDRFYIKGYDNTGRPRVLADNDFGPHVEPNIPENQNGIDLSQYATKEDIKALMNEAVGSIKLPNLSCYVTVSDLNKALSELSVGNGGRIVRTNESNA